MRSRKQLLNNASVYLILDRQVNTYEQLFEIAREAIPAGVDIVQLRDKHGTAKDILSFSKQILKLSEGRVPYIVNDRVDLALVSGAWGVHLGQEDLSVAVARKILGPKALIGVSCQTLKHVRTAMEDKADYIGFGSIFKTLTKPERNPMDIKMLKRVITSSEIPLFTIGGIALNNLEQLSSIGVNRIAVCRAICQAKNISDRVGQFKAGIGSAS